MSDALEPDAALRWLIAAGAQNDVVEWTREHAPGWEQWWADCPRADWMLATAARVGVPGDRLLQAALACVPVLSPYLPVDEPLIERALSFVRTFARGDHVSDATLASELNALLSASSDVGAHAAVFAVSALVDAVESPMSAATYAASIAHAAMVDAGDCAMLQAKRYTDHACAEAVRTQIDGAFILGRLRG